MTRWCVLVATRTRSSRYGTHRLDYANALDSMPAPCCPEYMKRFT